MNHGDIVQKVFDDLKSEVNTITSDRLAILKQDTHRLLDKYCRSGQIKAARKLLFVLKTLDKESKLVDIGIDRFVYKDDIDYYIDNCTDASHPVKIIELKNYVRDIPEQAVEAVERTRDIFDEFFVVYTDYTGNDDRRVEAEQRRKDPILFGAFLSEQNRVCVDRFYFLADWVDPYCDLTLDKMISELSEHGRSNAEKRIDYTPRSIDQLENIINQYKETNGNVEFYTFSPSSYTAAATYKPSMFTRIRKFFFG